MEIKRNILSTLEKWKNSPERKPGLIMGARQIGKSWVMDEFGKRYYEHYAKFDFDENPELITVFHNTKDPKRLIKDLGLYVDVPLEPYA